jgi:hypothetical protein
MPVQKESSSGRLGGAAAAAAAAAGALVLAAACSGTASASASARAAATGTRAGPVGSHRAGKFLPDAFTSVKAPITSGDVPCGTALSAVTPATGSTVMLKSGCTYSKSLVIRASNVTVTSYGTGHRPVVTLSSNGAATEVFGTHDKIENLSLHGVAPRLWSCGGKKTPAGDGNGIELEPGSADDTISAVSATGFYAAVYVMAGSAGNLIKSSTFTSNLQLNVNSSAGSSGAFGVLLQGNGNTVEDNTITNNQACSLAYDQDGSAVEIYGGSHNLITGNKASNDNAFTELGSYAGHIATKNIFTGNTVTDGANSQPVTFLITRGAADSFGPVIDTVAARNKVTLTKAGDQGAVSYAWRTGEGTLLTLTDNDLNLGTRQALYEDGGYVNGGGNRFTGTCNPSRAC